MKNHERKIMTTQLWVLLATAIGAITWATGYEFGWRMRTEQDAIHAEVSGPPAPPFVFTEDSNMDVLDKMLETS